MKTKAKSLIAAVYDLRICLKFQVEQCKKWRKEEQYCKNFLLTLNSWCFLDFIGKVLQLSINIFTRDKQLECGREIMWMELSFFHPVDSLLKSWNKNIIGDQIGFFLIKRAQKSIIKRLYNTGVVKCQLKEVVSDFSSQYGCVHFAWSVSFNWNVPTSGIKYDNKIH